MRRWKLLTKFVDTKKTKIIETGKRVIRTSFLSEATFAQLRGVTSLTSFDDSKLIIPPFMDLAFFFHELILQENRAERRLEFHDCVSLISKKAKEARITKV